ncbi:MAG: hypothetical protein Q7T55_20290, partial [Solirubrobacteraceae bacterium]|nr:hypothetical protein [Solirubrobacteraceae bacterium]
MAIAASLAGAMPAMGVAQETTAPPADPSPVGTEPEAADPGPSTEPLGPDATRAERFVDALSRPLPPGEPVLGVSPELERGAYVAKILES